MNPYEKFLNLLVCSGVVCASILVIVLLITSSCGTPALETPILHNVSILAPDSAEVRVDGILQGYGACTVILVENYPNYLEIGPWSFVLFPDCDYDLFGVKSDSL